MHLHLHFRVHVHVHLVHALLHLHFHVHVHVHVRVQVRVTAHGPSASNGPPSLPCRPFRCLASAPVAPTPFNVACVTPRDRPVTVRFDVSAGGGVRADGSAVRLRGVGPGGGGGAIVRSCDIEIGVQQAAGVNVLVLTCVNVAGGRGGAAVAYFVVPRLPAHIITASATRFLSAQRPSHHLHPHPHPHPYTSLSV